MNDPNIDITLRTLGADEAEAGLKKVEAAGKGLSAQEPKAQDLTAKATAQRGLNNTKDAELRTLAKKVDATMDEAKAQQVLAQAQNQVTRQTAVQTEAFSASGVALGNSSKKISQFVTQAGYQVTDFTVQVGAGTSAVTAFSQQAPQLLSALSGVGLVSGAAAISLGVLSAAIPIVLFGGKALLGMFGDVQSEAKNATLGADDLAESLRKATELNLDETIADTNTARTAAKALEQDWELTKEAEAESSTAALTNAAKVAEARRLIAEVLGQEIDKLGEIKRLAEEEQKKRELATQQAIASQQKKIEDGKEAIQTLQDELEMHQKIAFKMQADLSTQQQRLELLLKQKKANEDILKAKTKGFGETFGAIATGDEAAQREISADLSRRTAARAALKDPQATQDIANLKQQVDMLDTKLSTYTRAQGGLIDKTAQKISEAQVKLQDQSAATESQIDRLQETLAADTLLAKAKTAVDVAKTSATELEDLVNQIQPSLESGKAAKEAVLKATDGGKITADEVAAVSANMSILIGQVQTHTASTSLTVTEILTLYKSSQTEMNKLLKTAGEISRESNRLTRSVQADQTGVLGALEQMVNTQKAISSRLERLENRR